MNQFEFTTQNELTFLLNTYNFTAILFNAKDAAGDIFIPYSINFNNQDYIIIAIGQSSFFYNKKITSILFPNNSKVKSIESSAFSNSSIITCNIPKSLTKICNKAFSCSNLEIIEIPPDCNLEIIEEFAFFNTKITKFTIPSKLRELCSNVFYDCSSLKIVDYHPNSELHTIESSAFELSGIETLKIPPSLKHLNGIWCNRTEYLKNIIVSPKNKNFCFSEGKYLYGKSNKDNELYDVLYFVNREIEEIIIPKYVKIIGKSAINYCNKIKTIKFNEDSECYCFDEYSFNHSSLEYISIPKSVSVIQKKAFCGCEKLNKIEIPENSELTKICGDAFADTNLTSLYFPPKLIELEESWCNLLNTLNSIEISKENKNFSFIDNKFLYGKTDKNNDEFDILYFVIRNINDTFLTIPLNTKIIAPYSFANCENLFIVNLCQNNQLTLIDNCAFEKSSLFEIDLPKSLEKIGLNAFLEDINLHYVDVPIDSNLKTICENAFDGTSFMYFYFPKNLTKIDKNAFRACDVKYFDFSPLINIKKFDKCAFSLTLVEKIKIPSSVAVIDDECFYQCERLKFVEFPPDSCLEKIGISAFAKCALVCISIPIKTTKIDDLAFESCRGLKVIEILGNDHSITISKNAFKIVSEDFSIFSHKTTTINVI